MAAVKSKVSNLTKVITNLENGLGSTSLPSLKSIQLQIKERNSSPSLRAFKKQVLPRLAFSNPQLEIKVNHLRTLPSKSKRVKMSEEERTKISQEVENQGSESLVAEFHNMPTRTIPLTGQSVSGLAKELLDLSHQGSTSASSKSSSEKTEEEKTIILEKVAESQGASQAQL